MSEELKPCPFCGAPAELEEGIDHHGAWFNLGCSRHWGHVRNPDSANTCIAGRMYYTETEVPIPEAIAAWNTRQSATTEALAAMEQAREALSAFTMCARYQPHMGGGPSFKGWAQNDLRQAEAKARQALATLTEQIERMRNEPEA